MPDGSVPLPGAVRNAIQDFDMTDTQLFWEQFAFQSHALVNFVGGGGKTALIHRLMQECSASGTVLCTTTTRIHPPGPGEGLVLISSDNLPLLKIMAERVGRDQTEKPYKLIVTRGFMSPNLLRGVPADFGDGLDRSLFPIMLNEADGAASFSIKLPREGEPVLMNNAEYLVPVLGMDCLNQPIGPTVVFRFRALGKLFSLREGDPLTPETAANLLMHRQGVCKGWQEGMNLIPFINKVDEASQDDVARDLALRILHNRNFPVKRVLFGSVLHGKIDSISVS